MARCVKRFERAPGAEIYPPDVTEGNNAFGGSGQQITEQPVHRWSEDSASALYKFGWVSQVPRAPLVYDHLTIGVHRRDIARATRMIKVNVRHDNRRKICCLNTEVAQTLLNSRSRLGGACFDQTGPVTADEISRCDAGVATHAGIDGKDVLTKVDNSIHRQSFLGSLSTGSLLGVFLSRI
jgi:hypothetical protein